MELCKYWSLYEIGKSMNTLLNFNTLQQLYRKAETESKIFLVIYDDPSHVQLRTKIIKHVNVLCKVYITPWTQHDKDLHQDRKDEWEKYSKDGTFPEGVIRLDPITGSYETGFWTFFTPQNFQDWQVQHSSSVTQAMQRDILYYLDEPLDRKLVTEILTGRIQVLEKL